MEEDNTMKEMLETEIKTCLDGLKYVEQGEEQHAKLSSDIQHLVAAYVELEKLDNSKIDADRRFKEEIRQKELDRDYKDMLERDKMQIESERRKEEMKENRISGWRDAGIKAAGIIFPLALYGCFAGLGLRLEFIENGSITGFTLKELFRILHPKPNVM